MSSPFVPLDAPNAKLATAYITIGDRRYNLFNAKSCEVTGSVSSADVPRLGAIIMGKKPIALEVKISMTVYKCSEMFDKLVEDFKNTGILQTFELQVTNEDNASCTGRSEKIYRDCVLDGDVLLSMFDADGELIEQEIEAYAMDFTSNSRYTEPEYM